MSILARYLSHYTPSNYAALGKNSFEYLRYLHKFITSVLPIPSAIRRAKFHLSSVYVIKVSLFGYIHYLFFRWKIDNIHKWANSANNGEREMELGSLDGRDFGEYTGVGYVELSQIYCDAGRFFSLYTTRWLHYWNASLTTLFLHIVRTILCVKPLMLPCINISSCNEKYWRYLHKIDTMW